SFLSQSWNNFWGGIGDAFENVWNGIQSFFKDVANGIIGGLEGLINGAIDLVNGMIDGFNSLPTAVIGLTIGRIPKVALPRLAQGATILPRRGGTAAILGEGGRAESVVDTGLMN